MVCHYYNGGTNNVSFDGGVGITRFDDHFCTNPVDFDDG